MIDQLQPTEVDTKCLDLALTARPRRPGFTSVLRVSVLVLRLFIVNFFD